MSVVYQKNKVTFNAREDIPLVTPESRYPLFIGVRKNTSRQDSVEIDPHVAVFALLYPTLRIGQKGETFSGISFAGTRLDLKCLTVSTSDSWLPLRTKLPH
jgi:hypothetical protein